MKLFQRIMALLGVFALLAMVGLTLYFAITGSPYFMASLYGMLVLPVLIYGYLVIYRTMSGRKDGDGTEDEKEEQ